MIYLETFINDNSWQLNWVFAPESQCVFAPLDGTKFPRYENYGLDWEFDISWIQMQKNVVIHWKMSPLQPFEVGVWHRWTLVKMTTARAKGGWAASTLFRRNRSNGLQFYLKRPFMCLHDICEPIMKMGVHGQRLRQRAHTLKALCIIMNKVGTIDRSMSQWGLNMHQSVHQGPQICLLCGQMDAKMYWNGTNRWT